VTPTSRPDRRPNLSLGTRIFLVTSLLIALSVGASVAVTALLVNNVARNAAMDSLQGSAHAQEIQQDQYYEQLKLASSLFAQDPNLTAYIGEAQKERDVASIVDLLGSRQSSLKFSFAIVLDPAGRVIARTDNPAPAADLTQTSQLALVREARTGPNAPRDSAGVWREGDRLYYAVAVPMTKAFELLGFMVTAFEITNTSAKRINSASGGEIAFVARDPDGGVRVTASTLDDSMQKSLAAALAGPGGDGRPLARAGGGGAGGAGGAGDQPRAVELSLSDDPWMALRSPLRDASGRAVGELVALASMRKVLAPFRRIEEVVLLSGLAVLLIAPFLSLAFARRTLQPVRRLVEATEAARQGDYDTHIVAESADEIGQLAGAFDVLLSDLREKRDMEAYVTELSRNLPEPVPARVVISAPQARESLLMGIELRGYANPRLEAGGAEQVIARLGLAMQHLEATVTTAGGQIEGIAGHRVLARFDRRGRRPLGALQAAAEILQPHSVWGDDTGAEAPSIAIAAGTVVTGPVVWGDQSEHGLVGQPVQQVESLLREATPGDLVLGRDVYQQLREYFVRAGYELAPRRGLISPQPIYVLTADLAARLTGAAVTPATGSEDEAGAGGADEAALLTLSGLAPGTLMGRRFQVLSVLGTGGMGVVYKARDRELDDLVALKVLRRDMWGDRVQLERMKSEIKLARKITHPNVLRTFDFGELDRVAFISMEYVRGVTLRYMLDQAHRLPYSAGLRLGKQLCAGLAAAHAVGVIHRDIKPENLILEPTGNAKLMDFGIARPVTRLTPGQTQAGFVVGTPQYLAPEQVQSGEIDTRADIYSAGVVLYEIFTGEVPFRADSAMEVLVKHLQEEPPPPRSKWGEMPERLEAAILRCLRKHPSERFQKVEELQHELEALSA
jgi:HAMP domain-containing protein/tRNA A-37 threonylcarbamoyl transferase component Bud32